ncbi:MAG: PQQ-binding-like beta-propeller repeat protein [Methylomicrobium sp.]|nr:PQQ-binding-like beta-propeller repeat protein [Methylomicrobium sp.]
MNNSPSISRPSTPEVPAVVFGGVRYEQDATDERQGDQEGGYLAAIDVETGERLWRLKIYEVPDSRSAGVEMGGVYFRTMKILTESNALKIENEVGSVYRVDLTSHEVQKLSGPPDEASPTETKPKPTPE